MRRNFQYLVSLSPPRPTQVHLQVGSMFMSSWCTAFAFFWKSMLFESNYGIVQVTSAIDSLRFRIRATCFRNSVCHPLTTHDHLMSHHYYLLCYYINTTWTWSCGSQFTNVIQNFKRARGRISRGTGNVYITVYMNKMYRKKDYESYY